MDEKDKRRYAYGGFLPVVNLCIQPDSDLICDDLVEELATIPTSMLILSTTELLMSYRKLLLSKSSTTLQ